MIAKAKRAKAIVTQTPNTSVPRAERKRRKSIVEVAPIQALTTAAKQKRKEKRCVPSNGYLPCDGDGERAIELASTSAAPKSKRATRKSMTSESRLSRNGGNGDTHSASEVKCATRRKSKGVVGDSAIVTAATSANHSKNNRPADLPSDNDVHNGEGVKHGSVGDLAVVTELRGADACRKLQELQRSRASTIKSRCAIERQLESHVSNEFGYHAGLEEADRKARFKRAKALIKAISKGSKLTGESKAVADRVAALVVNTKLGSDGFVAHQKRLDREMTALVKTLPVSAWCDSIRGFGLMSLGVIVGECGDLSNYAGPAKVWKRLGLAPYQGKMPSTWRRSGGLTADQWSEIGYSPRRRALMYVIAECLVKSNGTGDYRKMYDRVKVEAKEKHPDWTKLHIHLHAMLLIVKRLLLNLWKEWNRK